MNLPKAPPMNFCPGCLEEAQDLSTLCLDCCSCPHCSPRDLAKPLCDGCVLAQPDADDEQEAALIEREAVIIAQLRMLGVAL